MPFKFDTLSGNQISIPLQPKAIHDEQNAVSFDPFGRMMASLGVEAPGATPLLQNVILFPYVNPATEVLDGSDEPSSLDVTPISTNADGTQIWKITHNGVDTHPIHWHLYDVQLINRVTWDNIIIPPDPNELGWKDTIRVSPLEDTYVAVRPILPTIPWGVPDSKRPLNPMMPLGAKGSVAGQVGSAGIEAGFNNTDVDGNPIDPIVNEVVNFNWEYVWHCHILSHEEMDMMRPQSVKAPEALPQAPVLTAPGDGVLNWTDATPVDMTDPNSWTLTGAAKGTAEVGFKIQRADVGHRRTSSPTWQGAGQRDHLHGPRLAGTGYYRVVAWNAAGESPSDADPGLLRRSRRADERGRDARHGWRLGRPVVDGSGQRRWLADHGLRDPEEPRDGDPGLDRCGDGRQCHEHDGDGPDPERRLHLPGPCDQRSRQRVRGPLLRRRFMPPACLVG